MVKQTKKTEYLIVCPFPAIWDALRKIYEQKDHKFLFVLDEWDAVFHMPFISQENQKEYLLFLKWLFKDQPYVEFVYMTGVIPIAKYSSGSELNMFVEYDMATSEKFSEYFGFSDVEVDHLYEIYQREHRTSKFSREELRIWYDGYYTATGIRLYNPCSVVLALTDNQLRNYWTSSGLYDELFYYVRHNIEDVRNDLVLLVTGERVAADIGQFASVSMEINSREEIYSAMVVYGLLTYENGEVLIPNKELMDKFNELLLSKDSLGYVYELAKKSEQMLQATIAGDIKMMQEIKVDITPDEAITQIKDKGYALCFKERLGKEPEYTGRILAVGISYSKKTKEHSCKIEMLEI